MIEVENDKFTSAIAITSIGTIFLSHFSLFYLKLERILVKVTLKSFKISTVQKDKCSIFRKTRNCRIWFKHMIRKLNQNPKTNCHYNNTDIRHWYAFLDSSPPYLEVIWNFKSTFLNLTTIIIHCLILEKQCLKWSF